VHVGQTNDYVDIVQLATDAFVQHKSYRTLNKTFHSNGLPIMTREGNSLPNLPKPS